MKNGKASELGAATSTVEQPDQSCSNGEQKEE